MARLMAKILVCLACALFGAACGDENGGNSNSGNSGAGNANTGNSNAIPRSQIDANSREVDSALSEVFVFAGEVQRKLAGNENRAAGVDEAQTLLDSRKAEIRSKVEAVRKFRDEELNETARARRGEVLGAIGTGMRSQMVSLGLHQPPAELKAKVDKLLRDYDETFK